MRKAMYLIRCLVFVVVLPFCSTAPGTISFRVTQVEVKETNLNSAKLTIQRSGGSDGDIDFICKILNSTSDKDFSSNEDTDLFTTGQSSSDCTFYVKDDNVAEGNETFVVELSVLSGIGSVSSPSRSLIKIIANDDAYGVVGFNELDNLIFHEPRTNSSTPERLLLQRHVGSYGAITVHWRVIPKVPASSHDITPTSGIVSFRNGEDKKNLEFSVYPDQVTEEVEEFTFELTSVYGGARLNSSSTKVNVKVSANDMPLRFALSHITVPENQTSVTIWIYRGLDASGTKKQGFIDNLVSTASWYLKSGGATGGQDFNDLNGTVVFGKGETKKSVVITILEDNQPETAENFTVELTSLSPDVTLVPPYVCTIQILPNDDHSGVFKMLGSGSVTAKEDSMNNTAMITIERKAGLFGMVQVSWSVVPGGVLVLNKQISPTNGTVIFGDGDKFKAIVIRVSEDSVPEEAFSFVVELTSVSAGRLTDDPSARRKEVKVQDSDDVYGAFEFADASYQKLIMTNVRRLAEFVITRSGGNLRSVVVGYEIKYFSPDGIDQTSSIHINTSTTGSVTMLSGQKMASVAFTIAQDRFIQANSVFRIQLTYANLTDPVPTLLPAISPRLAARTTLNLTVSTQFADGEIGFPRTSVSVTEPENNLPKVVEITVFRDGTLTSANVLWKINNSIVHGNDLRPSNGSIAFGKGVASVNISLEILPDSIPELDESFVLILYNVSERNHRLQPGSSKLILTILSNDEPGGIFQFHNVKSFVYTEPSKFSVDVIRLRGDLDRRFVKIETTNGKNNVLPSEKTLVFAKGEIKMTTTFFVKEDDIPEINETVTFHLVSVTFEGKESSLGNFTEFNVTILGNDDPYGIIVFLNTSLSIVEGKDNDHKVACFVLERTRGLFGYVTVYWNVSQDNAALDISSTSGEVTFKPGEQFETLKIYSLPDNIPEDDETFTIQLTEITSGAKIGRPDVATLTILKNDDAIEFADTHVTVTEGSTATLTILRHGRNQESILVNYTTIDGSALSAENDYTPVNQQVVFPSGVVRETISIMVPDDNMPESDENFTVALTASTGDTSIYGHTVSTITIEASDDPNGIFNFDGSSELNKTGNEGETVSFRVTRYRGAFGTAGVHWQIYQIFTNGSRVALTAGDFQQIRGELVFENGVRSNNLELKLLSDKQAEYGETFEIRLIDVTGGPPGRGGKLADNLTAAYIHIPTNDHPYGLFAFGPGSLNVSVAEDTEPGFEYKAIANMTVVRKRGKDRNVGVSWCIYKIEDASNLGDIWDLIFLSETKGSVVINNPRRPKTGSRSLRFFAGVESYAVVTSLKRVPREGFTISMWIKPEKDNNGTILAKVTKSFTSYKLLLDTKTSSTVVNFALEIRTTSGIVKTSTNINSTILDNSWHNLVVAINNETGVVFYCDGDLISTNRSATFSGILDNDGDLYLGVSSPHIAPYQGTLQDIKIFTKTLQESDVKAIATPITDLTPINGYLDYPESVTTHVVPIKTVDNALPENEKIYSMVLATSLGGASIDCFSQSRTKLTVLKSDNANGLFQFSTDQLLSKIVQESSGNISFEVERLIAFNGQVTIKWDVTNETGLAVEDFIQPLGNLVFYDNERKKNLTVQINDEQKPELLKKYTLRLLSATSDDGKEASTRTSGASINQALSMCNITIEENDYPYGLLQFSGFPLSSVDNIVPLMDSFHWDVRESSGNLKLYIVRAQGRLGDIQCSWKTVPITAAENDDFIPTGKTVSLRAGETSVAIDIRIVDNDKPELNKTFGVELYGATNGAKVGPGGKALIEILPSDDAFGVVNFTSSSLSRVVREGQTFTLEVQRAGGALGPITISWQVDSYGENFVNSFGQVSMSTNERKASFSLEVKNDMLPELSKNFLLRLVNVTDGRLAPTDIVCNVTVVASDDPYGVFEFDPVFVSVHEANTNVTLNIVRRRGSMGNTRVYYSSVSRAVEGLRTERATEDQDYSSINSFVDFQSNQTSASVVVTIMDDLIPEGNETIVVNLTSVVLLSSSAVPSDAAGSPRIGFENLAKVIILQNDNASGIVQLSASAVAIKEDTPGSFLDIVRTVGTFGEIVVSFEVISGSAKPDKDYIVNARTVTIANNQSRAPVPISIVNDREPEFNKTFTVRLLSRGPNRDVVLGFPVECHVTITENDYPYGLIGFSLTSLNKSVSEPSSGNRVVNLTVVREFGTLDLVRLEWNVTLHGKLATNDVQKTEGKVFIAPGEKEKEFAVVVLADVVPEVNEVLSVTLKIIEGKASINAARREAHVTIQLNDEAHGVVEFSQGNYIVKEKDQNTTAHISIIRKRGTHGDLHVYYSTFPSTRSFSAIPFQDYLSVTNGSATIPDGVNASVVDIVIIGDSIPEFSKSFGVTLEYVLLVNQDGSSQPNIGPQFQANVTIEDDDYVYGLFKVFAKPNVSRIVVNETGGLIVYLAVQRTGGLIGDVQVSIVFSSESTATKKEDFHGSEATLPFRAGDSEKEQSIIIKDDSIPEIDETIIVKLVNPTGGASVAEGVGNNVTIVIQANDVVAGKVGFSSLSRVVVAKEGTGVVLTVIRSPPAAGKVSVDWMIVGMNASKDLNETSGTVHFKEGEKVTYIKTWVLADNTSETREQFQVILRNPLTSGVSRTGAAEIDDLTGSATITVEASNDPHGVVEFQQSSRIVTVSEDRHILELSVARLFGNIGAIRIYFTITNGSMQLLNAQQRLAVPGEDVNSTNTSIIIGNGVSVGVIPVNIVNDDIAELEEIFLVNITRVELISRSPINNATFSPPRLGRYLISEVTIEANDGPHGILMFLPSRISVPENITVFNLTVFRSQGTYGEIEVNYYISKINIQESDFNVYGGLVKGGEETLKFSNGQKTQNITVFVYDDAIPEGDETFEVYLKKPRHGAQLGHDFVAKVTILVNDAGNGIFKFDDSSLRVLVDEPGNKHVGTTKGSFTVVRTNGTIGDVVLGWSIPNATASIDFRSTNGTVTFKDGQTTASFVVETVVDSIPEREESFLVVLSVISGGGELNSPSQAWLIVSENEAPYGEFGFAVAPKMLSVEESIGFTEIKVLRHKGTYGQVTVDYYTTSQTADSSSGPVMRFGIFQSFPVIAAQTWFTFSAYGKQFLLIGSSSRVATSSLDLGSSLFRWQGVYTLVTKIATNNAVQWESFVINGQHYIAVANQGSGKNREVNSVIYKFYPNGTMEFSQNVPTKTASGVKFFSPSSGVNRSYLVFANMKTNINNTDIRSKIYRWSNGQFVEDGLGLNCRGASGLALFTIDNRDFLAISSYYDSVNNDYRSNSVIFEWKNLKFELIIELQTNGANGVEYFKINTDHFLVFANTKSSPALFKWTGTSFRLHQALPILTAKAVKHFLMDGEVFLAVTLPGGNSNLLKWNTSAAMFQFYHNITTPSTADVQPIAVQDSVANTVTLLAVAMQGVSESRLLQPAMMSSKADFIPRHGQLIYGNDDTELSFFVTILDDSISEPDETFQASLNNATGGSVVGPDKDLQVKILSNGNPYGRIQFATRSVYVVAKETARDSMVYLEVQRQQGVYGEVIVAWNTSGNATSRHGDSDVFPTSGEVIFAEGDARRTINLTIRADDVPEVNEVVVLRLTSLIKDGSDLPNKGATISSNMDTATVLIPANDEPHGIVGWRRTVVLAQESEATNSTVEVVLERRIGTIGDIEVSYSTVQAMSNGSSNERPAVPYQDFIPVVNKIVMTDGENITNISIHVIHDDNAELNEVFFVNITSVHLLHSYILPSKASPRVDPSSQITKIIISENDNKRGALNFNTTHLVDPRTGILKVNEDIGVLSLQAVRSGGLFGTIGFEYRLVPETVNKNDYFPTKGQIIFLPNETSHFLNINITDDNEAEVAEHFRVEMTLPIGGAKLGKNREVSVEIRASDQPYGVFEFSGLKTYVVEEGKSLQLTVTRLQGKFGEVHVKWNLSVGAFPDVFPANGTLTFHDNVTTQVIRLRARDDKLPDGDKIYVCHLVSADNGGVIGSENGVTLRIDANDDGYGVMAIDPATSLVFVGEPNLPSYNGQVIISIVRNAGTYGKVAVDWELASDVLASGKVVETFNVTKGTIDFDVGVKVHNITLQVKQDTYPEESHNFTFSLTGVSDARIDQSSSIATVVVVSSDNPYGIIDFDGPSSLKVTEDDGLITLNVVRNKGNNGRLLVTIDVVTSGATEESDFQISPKVLTIDDKHDSGVLNITILPEVLPELLETFTVSLGKIQLVTSRPVDYGYRNGLQVDMPPEVGNHGKVVVTILQNDDPHGVIEFKETKMIVHEHDRSVVVSVLRSGGDFGEVHITYSVTNITAQEGEDYVAAGNKATLKNGQRMVNITINLLDDKLPEDRESFRLDLISVDGGARLGKKKTVEIVLETSDNPDGLFGFVGKTKLEFTNPNASKKFSLGISRIGGARSLVLVNFKIFKIFPNTDDPTKDIFLERDKLTFPVNNFGPMQLSVYIIPFLDHQEVEEHFVVSIISVSGNASIDSLASNVTVIVKKHGMPNGLFGFTGDINKVTSEGNGPVVFTVKRSEGKIGDVEVSWIISDTDRPDFVNKAGTVKFLNDEVEKQISVAVMDDTIPELDEVFTVTLVSASGGGDIDYKNSNATVKIRASDEPHGRFGLHSGAQRVTIKTDLNRLVMFTVERSGGRFGEVRISYSLIYSKDYPTSLNGHVTIKNGESEVNRTVVLDKNAFLFTSSYFTLTLTSASYQGLGESGIPPTLIKSASTEDIPVPETAANSVVKFKNGFTKLRVNKDNQVTQVVISRDGFYGSVTVFIEAGFPRNKFPGFTNGNVRPSVASVTFNGNDKEKQFSVQITPDVMSKQSLVYAVYLSRATSPSSVYGGSRIDTAADTAIIESGGVVVMAPSSQSIIVMENETASLMVYRLFSSLGTIFVNYSATSLSKAMLNKDYVQLSSRLTMLPGEYKKALNIDIIDDQLPELDESFRVTITSVSGADARLGPNTTSNVTIKDNDSPYGIIYFNTVSVTVSENIATVNIVISRSGGTFGNVGAQIRTIGGGESWTVTGMEMDVLRKRNQSSVARMGEDYYSLNTRVNFKHEEPTPPNGQNQTVQLRIINDDYPELDEEIFLYLSDPSGGAKLASSGKKSWAVITIEGNDLFNGNIGLVTRSMTISEDKNPRGEIEVARFPTLGMAKVKWEALNPSDNLVKSSGIVTFLPNEATVKFEIQLIQDKIPELQSNFTVKLVGLLDTREATIDPTKNTLQVILLPSDDPFGLISFDKESRNAAVDISTKTFSLNVIREQGKNGKVTVSYKTTMLSQEYTEGELVISRALHGEDYSATQGTLTFDDSKSEPGSILIRLTPSTASSTSYPKAFNVTLFDVTGGARLSDQYSTTMVIISNARLTNQFLQLRSDSLKTPLSNTDMARMVNTLLALIVKKEQLLSGSQVSIVAEVLNNLLDDLAKRTDENDRKLTVDLSNQLMSIFDTLLDPEREDFSGKAQLTEPFVKYAFALVHGEPCPGAAVVKKSGKHAMVEGRRRLEKDINGLIIKSSVGKNFFSYPPNIYQTPPTTTTVTTSSKCGDVHFIEYFTDHWFTQDKNDVILNNRVLSTSVKNKSATTFYQEPSTFRIYASGRVTSNKAECLKWRGGSWDNSICTLKEETEDYIECECRHFSNFAVRAKSDDRVGYQFYFYIAAFICMISFFLVIVSHHTCSIENTFSSRLLMHMFFAGFALHVLVVVAAYVSPDLVNKPNECASLGILIHYFLLAHFTWIFVQCCNLWRILVLNDEHTDRKFIFYFMLGWGLPVVFVALYVIITHAVYDWDITDIYADVHDNGDMCFIRSAYGALASILGPVLLFLLAVAVVATQAYQVTLQWKLYDDIFRGHHNTREVFHLWVVFTGITLTWLFGGLHLAYGKLWLAIVFAIFETLTGLYVFMIYFVLRNQCRQKYRSDDYLNASSPSMFNGSPNDYLAERPVMYDAQSEHSLPKSELRFSPPPGNEWEEEDHEDGHRNDGLRTFNDHAFAEFNPLYDEYHRNKTDLLHEDVDEASSSQDLGDLIFALKTGESLQGNEKDDGIEMKDEVPKTEKLELRRVSIADTHV